MPWIKEYDRAYYSCPLVLSDDVWKLIYIWYPKDQRKAAGQLREEMLGYQKICEKLKDFDTARYFREASSELMKQYRGWESAIKIIQGDGDDYWHSHVSEPIAPYIDRSLEAIDFFWESRRREICGAIQ